MGMPGGGTGTTGRGGSTRVVNPAQRGGRSLTSRPGRPSSGDLDQAIQNLRGASTRNTILTAQGIFRGGSPPTPTALAGQFTRSQLFNGSRAAARIGARREARALREALRIKESGR